MKNYLFIFSLLFSLLGNLNNMFAQIPNNIDLLYNWTDESLIPSIYYNNTYNEIWGFVHENREYAVIGSSMGTHIFDVTDTENVTQIDFIEGKFVGEEVVHRDYHDHNGYLYMVCDEGPSSLQIASLHSLPDSLTLVYDSDELFMTSHNIFIDTATTKMYVCVPRHTNGAYNGLEVYDLANPVEPELLTIYNDYYAHDVYVKNDITYFHGQEDGFFVVDFSNTDNPQLLGSLTDYDEFGQGYNHSGWLSEDGNYYFSTDENHGLDIKVLDVSDFSDMKVVSLINSGVSESSMAHNVMVRGNYLYVAYYHDGLQIYDITNPLIPYKISDYKTYLPTDHESYRGAWGVYTGLPSGNILVSDMQYGLFVFDVGLNPISTNENMSIVTNENKITLYPTIVQQTMHIEVDIQAQTNALIQLFDVTGNVVFRHKVRVIPENHHYEIRLPNDLPTGYLFFTLKTEQDFFSGKILKID